MARLRSPEKRSAILNAAVHEIAASGLAAPTARIAQRAGVAEGTLFTYFASKEELLNTLYLELKSEVYRRINAGFPQEASLERRAWHIWSTYLEWAIEFPERRKASVQLHVSDVITPETRAATAPEKAAIEATLAEVESGEVLRGMPSGFAAATMAALQEATMEFIGGNPEQQEGLSERGFGIFWRAVG